jgi:hypothetical protein
MASETIDARLKAFITTAALGNTECDDLSEEAVLLLADWDKYIDSRPMALDARETATVLHALRIVQCEGRIEGCNAADCEHFEDCDALTNDEIDALCERLNCSDVAAKAPATPKIWAVEGTIPPDPEDKNHDRAEWALSAIQTFGTATGECFDKFEGEERTDILKQNISDFLANLAHLCDREGIDLRERLSTAQYHYDEETDNAGEQWMAESDKPEVVK